MERIARRERKKIAAAVKRRGYFFAAKRLAQRNFASQNSMKNEE
jgi:hypothetical protein